MPPSNRRFSAGLLWTVPAVILIALTGFFLWQATREPIQTIRIATGGQGGTYLPLGQGLAEIFNSELPDRVRAEALETSGSGDNLERLRKGECEMAIVQNDAVLDSDFRAIAPLYPEILHAVVRADAEIQTLDDLPGHRVAAGPENSGTATLVTELMRHFGLFEGIEWVHVGTMDAVTAFERGEIDAVFIVSGLRSSAAERLLAGGQARLLSLGSPDQAGSLLEGLRVIFPFLDKSVIPVWTYGHQPPEPVGTVAVQAVLMVREDMESDLVQDLAGAMFRNRVTLMAYHRAARHLTEQFDRSSLQAPLHEGAEAFFRRDAPPFYVEYAELMSLMVTLMLAVGSGMLALHKWIERTRKNRIDVYYLKIREIEERVRSQRTGPAAACNELLELRGQAFAELVEERLAADQSFTIFQDYITSEVRALERQIDSSASTPRRQPSADEAKMGEEVDPG